MLCVCFALEARPFFAGERGVPCECRVLRSISGPRPQVPVVLALVIATKDASRHARTSPERNWPGLSTTEPNPFPDVSFPVSQRHACKLVLHCPGSAKYPETLYSPSSPLNPMSHAFCIVLPALCARRDMGTVGLETEKALTILHLIICSTVFECALRPQPPTHTGL